MMMRTVLALVASSLYFATPAAAQVTRPVKLPIVADLTVGFSAPQYETAEFPGIVAAVAVLYPTSRTAGFGGVAEMDVSYVRLTRAVGARGYRRVKYTTMFGQVLVGAASGGYSGVITSTGGTLVQPGVGVRIGTNALSLNLQLDYRFVESGRIYDSRNGSTTGQSGVRYMVGFSFHPGR